MVVKRGKGMYSHLYSWWQINGIVGDEGLKVALSKSFCGWRYLHWHGQPCNFLIENRKIKRTNKHVKNQDALIITTEGCSHLLKLILTRR